MSAARSRYVHGFPGFASVRGTVRTPRWPQHGTVRKRVMEAGRVNMGGGADERKENGLSLTRQSAFTKHVVPEVGRRCWA